MSAEIPTTRWRPIETAPRDGREIVALDQDGAWIVFWRKFPGDQDFAAWQIKKAPGRDPVLCIHNPLGWTPLPETETNG